MGCGAVSKPVQDLSPKTKQSNGSRGSSAKANATKNFMHILNDLCPMVRLDHPSEPRQIDITGNTYNFTLQYVYVSQRGYYPNAMGKANQDSYMIAEKMLGDSSCNVFGIFDGHGEYGDYCSHYSADNLPHHLAKEIEKNGGTDASLKGKRMEETYVRAFLNTNFGLHSSKIDDTLSGTTGITIIQKGDKLLVANVGDSRAIVASEVNGKLVFSPLSSDQTPYRKDERERLKKAGAKIMTMDQIEGNEPMHDNFGTKLGEEIDEGGDPPRVWDATLEKPGCAFSRSIGDSVAKVVGVTAEPEILVWDISPQDRFAVIASDGVFEFITSQAVVDMIEKFTDKLAAAKHVVAEAYRLWLTFDDRTDDISIIILSFDNIKLNPHADPSAIARTVQQQPSLQTEEMVKPVRKVMSKAKRKDIAENWNKEDIVQIDFDKIEDNKTEDEIARISNMLSSNFMFENLSPIQKSQIFKVMKARNVKEGEMLIREGDQGDEMYIIDKGQFNVYKRDAAGNDMHVFTYTDEGAAFGELSLMYGKPRAASVFAKTDGRLWTISRAAFRAVMMGKAGGKGGEGLLEIYRAVPGLNELRLTDIQRLCSASKELTFNKGDLVINEDLVSSASWMVCVVITGVLRLIPKEESKKRQLRAELSFVTLDEVGTRFKEITADSKVKLSCIPKSFFTEVVGTELVAAMKDVVLKKKSKGKRLQMDKLPIVNEENFALTQNPLLTLNSFTFNHAIALIGDIGYVGTFSNGAGSKGMQSGRVFSKKRVLDAKMEKKILNERNYLAVLSNTTTSNKIGVPSVLHTFQDDQWLYILFQENFDCDLQQALQAQAVSDEAKPYFAASALSALDKVHCAGLIHRLVNGSSFQITHDGALKLTDFRFAKPMDGSFCYTICGDPLYFAPEIVAQQGYDYGADIWAFGVMLYELYEGASPFGTGETDETTIFRAISSYRPNKLVFTSKTPANAQALIADILQFNRDDRQGYKQISKLKSSNYFSDIWWDRLDKQHGYPVDIEPTIDLQAAFDSATTTVDTSTDKLFQTF